MAQVPNSSLYAYQDGLVVTAAQLNQDIQVLQTALNDNYYRLLRSVTVNGTAYQLQGTSGIINNVNLNTDSTVSATSSSDSQGNITVTFSVASGAISSGKIANGAVGTAQIANQAVTQALIANQAVGTPQIANYAVGVNQLDPTLVQQTSINLVQAKLAEAVLGLRNLLHPSQQSFTRASSAWRINGTAYVPSNVLRLEQGKFGQGAFIEESTKNLVPNSGFEDDTTTATLFSDTLTSYTGSTVPAPWTLQSGSFTFGASGATCGASGSLMTAGNAVWKPILGSDGTTKLAQTAQATFTTPATMDTTNGYHYGAVYLKQDANNHYYARINAVSNLIQIVKLVAGTETGIASASFTPASSTAYVVSLSLDNTGVLTAHVKTGGTDVTGSPITATDTSLTGGFLIGVGGDTGVVISNASVTAPWANSWTIGGDSRVAWGLTQSAIGGKYSVGYTNPAGVAGDVQQQITVSNGQNYTVSLYANTSSGTTAQLKVSDANSNPTLGGTTNINGVANARYEQTFTANSYNTALVQLWSDTVGTVTFDNIQLEQKPYATTYVEVTSAASGATATRNADSLSYNLSNPLPSSWFGALVWKPQLSKAQYTSAHGAEIYTVNNLAGSVRYEVGYYPPTGNFYFKKNGDGAQEVDVSGVSFNAGDFVFIAFKDDPTSTGMTLYVSVNSSALNQANIANATVVTDAQKPYLGCSSITGYECNGTIDFPIISDVIPTSDQITSLANATDWGGTRDWGGSGNLGGGAYVDGAGNLILPYGMTFFVKDINGVPQQFIKDLNGNTVALGSASKSGITDYLGNNLLKALSGGYKVQSGMTSASCTGGTTTAITVTLPTALKNQTSPVVASASANGYNIRVTQAFAISLNQLTIVVYNESATVTAPISWVVIDNG